MADDKEIAALRYIRDIGAYWGRKTSLLLRIRGLNETKDGVGAFRYDGQPGAGSGDVSDRWDATMEKLDRLKAELEEQVRDYEEDYQHALDIFARDTFATAVWLHYGERRMWFEVAKMLGYSETHLWHHKKDGLEFIYEAMPNEYKWRSEK